MSISIKSPFDLTQQVLFQKGDYYVFKHSETSVKSEYYKEEIKVQVAYDSDGFLLAWIPEMELSTYSSESMEDLETAIVEQIDAHYEDNFLES